MIIDDYPDFIELWAGDELAAPIAVENQITPLGHSVLDCLDAIHRWLETLPAELSEYLSKNHEGATGREPERPLYKLQLRKLRTRRAVPGQDKTTP